MSFLCCLCPQKNYIVQVYTSSGKSRSSSTDSQTGSQPQNRENMSIENLPILNTANISFFGSNQNIPASNNFQESLFPATLFNLNPEQLSQLKAQHQIIHSRKIKKEQVAHLLKNKEKWIQVDNYNFNELVVRMVKKSQFQLIITSDYKGKKWRDPNFQQKKTYKPQNQEMFIPIRWDPLQALPTNVFKSRPSTFMYGGSVPTDILQGEVGDCYFLSAVAALTRRPERIMRLFPDIRKLGKNGAYMARMMFKGILQEVVVDEFFPIQVLNQKLLGCQPGTGNETYVMILEKCWAKLWKSYDAIDGGMPHEALHALTGAPTKNYILSLQTATQQSKSLFFSQVLTYSKNDFVMCVGTGQLGQRHVRIQHQILGEIEIKVVNQHIYSIEQFFIKDGSKMVRIYNPWGYNSMNQQKIQGQVNIKWDEFIQNFTYLTVSKVYDDANYLYMQMQNCKKDKFTFIQLDVFQINSGYFAITVSQTDQKQKEEFSQYLTVTYIVLRQVPSHLKDSQKQYELKTIRTQHKFSDHYLELSEMVVGKYIIAIYFSEVQVKQNLTFGVYSSNIFGFAERQMSKTFCDNFLHTSLINYDRKYVKDEFRIYPFPNNKNIWASFNMMVNSSALGYFILHVDKNQKRGVKAMMGNNAFKQKMLKVWDQNREVITFTAKQGQETIAIISTDNFRKYKDRQQQHLANNKKNITNKQHFHQEILIDYTLL